MPYPSPNRVGIISSPARAGSLLRSALAIDVFRLRRTLLNFVPSSWIDSLTTGTGPSYPLANKLQETRLSAHIIAQFDGQVSLKCVSRGRSRRSVPKNSSAVSWTDHRRALAVEHQRHQ